MLDKMQLAGLVAVGYLIMNVSDVFSFHRVHHLFEQCGVGGLHPLFPGDRWPLFAVSNAG